jgi:hypothetical protein
VKIPGFKWDIPFGIGEVRGTKPLH